MKLSLPGWLVVSLAVSLPLSSPAQAPASPDAAKLSEELGFKLFEDSNLWDDDPTSLSQRLSWQLESRTGYDESYRAYAEFGSTLLGGAHPSCMSFHVVGGKPAYVTMAFANLQDIARDSLNKQGVVLPLNQNDRQKLITRTAAKLGKEVKEALKKDTEAIQAKLTSTLGAPKRETIGQGAGKHVVERWDWNGHSFLLSVPKEEYVILKIVPSAAVGEAGRKDDALKDTIKTRVEKKPNGDVILKDLPALDQGPKGYCVAANWERSLRYLGLHADLFELAMAANSQPGSTYADQVTGAATELAHAAGRRIETAPGGRVGVRTVQKLIDAGLPVMWSMTELEAVSFNVGVRTGQRATVQDMKIWKETIKNVRKDLRKVRVADGVPHVCIIVGYNEQTGELAVLDSWKPFSGEQWITEDEAQTISGRDLTVVTW